MFTVQSMTANIIAVLIILLVIVFDLLFVVFAILANSLQVVLIVILLFIVENLIIVLNVLFLVKAILKGGKNLMIQKVPPDKCSICPLCPFYRACNASPVLVPYDKEISYQDRIRQYRKAVYSCQTFINRMTDN